MVENQDSKRLHKRLPEEAPWQALRTRQSGQACDPFRTPVRCTVVSLGVARCAPSSIALGFARIFVGIGISAAAAFNAIEFLARGKVVAFVTTSQVSVYFEMDNHGSVSW
ncbi:hypothetical protein JET70_18420 [Pseudomonas koreensis]|nr:hypothetical protein [Pseudomonas koreensis]